MWVEVVVLLDFPEDYVDPDEQEGPVPEVTGSQLRAIGDLLHRRHYVAAQIIDLLRQDGWSIHDNGKFFQCRHPEVHTKAQGRRRLRKLGIRSPQAEVCQVPVIKPLSEEEQAQVLLSVAQKI